MCVLGGGGVSFSDTTFSFECADQAPNLRKRDLTDWSNAQRRSYCVVAKRYQQENSAYYTLLAIGVVGAVKLEQFKEKLEREKLEEERGF